MKMKTLFSLITGCALAVGLSATALAQSTTGLSLSSQDLVSAPVLAAPGEQINLCAAGVNVPAATPVASSVAPVLSVTLEIINASSGMVLANEVLLLPPVGAKPINPCLEYTVPSILPPTATGIATPAPQLFIAVAHINPLTPLANPVATPASESLLASLNIVTPSAVLTPVSGNTIPSIRYIPLAHP